MAATDSDPKVPLVDAAAPTYPALPEPVAPLGVPVGGPPAVEEKQPKRLTNFELVMANNDAFPASMNSPAYGLVLNGMMLVDAMPEKAAVEELCRTELLYFVRFRSVILPSGVVQPCECDVAQHVRVFHENLAAPVEELIAQIGQQELDPRRPMWEVVLVPKPGCPFVVARVHHAIGDGFTLSSVFERLFRNSEGGKVSFAGGAKRQNMLQTVAKPPGKRAKAKRAFGKCCRGVMIGCDSVASFFKNVAISKARFETDQAFSPVPQKRDGLVYSGSRRVIFFPNTKLAFVKELKNAARGMTINDVLMACFGGAVREYCLAMEQEQGGEAFRTTKAPMIRALVPFAFPKPAQGEDDVANNFAFVSVPLPVGEAAGATERVQEVHRSMGKVKNSTIAPVALWLVNKVAPKLPKSEQQKTSQGLFARHSVVYSNVPGPEEAVYLCGQRCRDLQCVFFNPIPQVILLSYNGEVGFNLTFDPDVITKPDLFVELYKQQMVQLADELGVSHDDVFSQVKL